MAFQPLAGGLHRPQEDGCGRRTANAGRRLETHRWKITCDSGEIKYHCVFSKEYYGSLAQSVEQWPFKPLVPRSSRGRPTICKPVSNIEFDTGFLFSHKIIYSICINVGMDNNAIRKDQK